MLILEKQDMLMTFKKVHSHIRSSECPCLLHSKIREKVNLKLTGRNETEVKEVDLEIDAYFFKEINKTHTRIFRMFLVI